MKTKTMVASLVSVCAVFAVLLLLPVVAAAQTCFFVGTTPDGRVLGPYSLSSATDDISLAFTAETQRSYVIEVMTSRGPSGSGSLGPSININTGFCPNSDVGMGFTIRDITNITPTCNSGCSGGTKRSIIVIGGTASFLEMRIGNSDAAASQVVVAVTETTLFNPAWSTFGTFETFYSCINTTNSTLNATLRLFDTTGAQVSSFDFNNIPAGGTVSRNTGSTSLNVANNLNGSARLAHDGPPEGIICEAAIADFATAPRVIQPVKFEARKPR